MTSNRAERLDADEMKDIVPRLADQLYTHGIRDVLIEGMKNNNTLQLTLAEDFLRLPPPLQQKAYDAVKKSSNRLMIDFIEHLAQELRKAVELEGVGDRSEDRRKWKPFADPPPHASSRQPNHNNGTTDAPGNDTTGGHLSSQDSGTKSDGLTAENYDPSTVSEDVPTPGFGGAQEGEQAGQKPPEIKLRTAREYFEYLNDFVAKNLGPFEFDEETKLNLATRALEVAAEIQEEYELTDEQMGKFARLSLFDIFILCDNSGSMMLGNRVEALNCTLQKVAHWATRIEKDGISLRFLNHDYDSDGTFDGLTEPDEIDELIYNITLDGSTKLGTMLKEKVVQPLEERAKRRATTGEKMKPRIILIITDGEPSAESDDCLRNEILAAKTGILGSYGKAATIFIITRVGTSSLARGFIEGLSQDSEVKDLILTANTRLETIIKKLVTDGNSRGYEKYLIELFIDAVDGQSIPR